MGEIRITRDLTLDEPLINHKGQRVSKIRLSGSFSFNEFGNESYIRYDNTDSVWYFDLDTLIQEFTLPLQDQINNLQDQINNLQDQINVL